MNQSKRFLTLSCLLAVSLGCGQPNSAPQTPQPSSQSLKGSVQKEDPFVLTLTEDQLSVLTDSNYFTVEAKLPSLDQLKLIKELKVVSAEIKKYSFNETDIYLDPYNEGDEYMFPFVQVQLPTPVFEKNDNQVRLSLPGKEVAARLEFLLKYLRKGKERCQRIRMRILATDKTKLNNPIQIVLIGTVWEATD